MFGKCVAETWVRQLEKEVEKLGHVGCRHRVKNVMFCFFLKEEMVIRSNAIFRSSKIKTEESVGLRDMDGDHWIAQQEQFRWNRSLL